MKIGRGFGEGLMSSLNLPKEPIPGRTLVELMDSNRLVLENHQGIVVYTDQEVCVKLKQGYIQILGENLHFSCVNREYLIIKGKLRQISLKNEV